MVDCRKQAELYGEMLLDGTMANSMIRKSRNTIIFATLIIVLRQRSMIPKTLFHSVGSFDSRYAPAYYEDTDLAFKIRRAGYKVLYQPLSEVIHYEGATGGTDLTTGTKKHQEINRSTFAEKWAAELMTKPTDGDLTFLAGRHRGEKYSCD